MEYSQDDFLGGKIKLLQSLDGYRATSDAITLAAAISELKSNSRILDVGAGTGAVSLALACRLKEVSILGIELQKEYVKIANQNAELNNYTDRVQFLQGDIFENNTLVNQNFDCVISNPPFMDKADYASPDSARDKTRREVNLKKWIEFCVRRTKDYGIVCLITKPDKLTEVLEVLSLKTGAIKVYPIYSKPNIAARKVVVMAVKSSKAKLEIMPAIVLHEMNGKPNFIAELIQKDGKSFNDVLQIIGMAK